MKQLEELGMLNDFKLAILLCVFSQIIESVGDILNKTNTVCTWFSFNVDEKNDPVVKNFIDEFAKEY